MTNLRNFDVTPIMNKISEYAPFALLIMAIGTFVIIGIFRTDYYSHLFEVRFEPWAAMAMAVFAAFIEEGVRLALRISSIRDFSDNKKGNGWLGLIASVALVWHEITTATHVAELWAGSQIADVSVYKGWFVFFILVGLILEIRLILTSQNTSLGNPQRRSSRPAASSNGHQVPAYSNGTR
ncbi:hypothetical protein [Phaeodactylibacter xiamenensis]|uniref:hypothetical protein n=1 Tax=Phaeodactylibacter xiamenensis TaxID=1524460 RepID=UPI0024A9D69B|nr:hypothetical protein [Phaeodactylibacter xiamenensis]